MEEAFSDRGAKAGREAPFEKEAETMLRWAILFLIGAGIAAILGFIVFVDIISLIFKLLAIVLFILFVVTYLRGRGRVMT